MLKPLALLIAAALLTANAALAQLPPPTPPNSQPSLDVTPSPPAMTPPRMTPPHVTGSPHPATAPHAKTPRRRNAPGGGAGDAAVITGRVQQWLLNPNGEADGFLLADGTQVAFPPHLSAAVMAAVNAGDRVQVIGWRAPDVPMMRLQSLTANNQTVIDQPPERGRPGPRREDSGALGALSATGRIDRLLYNDRGDLHGVVLSDKTIVRFPPHVGASLAEQMTVGDSLSAVGWGTRVPQGTALEATRLGASPETLTDVLGIRPQPRPSPQGRQLDARALAPRGPGGMAPGVRPPPPPFGTHAGAEPLPAP